MKLLAVVIPTFIYHGCSTWKTFWEGKFTLGEFIPLNMKSCGRLNIRKHREINNGEKYIALDISLKFGILEKMKITYSYPKDYMGRSGTGLIASMGLKTILRSKKKEKARYTITNVNIKYILKNIKDF